MKIRSLLLGSIAASGLTNSACYADFGIVNCMTPLDDDIGDFTMSPDLFDTDGATGRSRSLHDEPVDGHYFSSGGGDQDDPRPLGRDPDGAIGDLLDSEAMSGETVDPAK